ncbi:ATP-dependent DNA helicase [Phormidium tenue FACHB-886]|nr:ATP-dependent DNA helicase [Phormidium tenue FACHB-886]
MIEVEVHQQLRAFLREQGEPYWHHHLTMARLVARALRLGRSALIQAGAPTGYQGCYRLSYLMSLLLWQEPAVLVASEAVQQRLLMVEIPRLRQWLPVQKAIQTGDRYPEGFRGLLLTSPQAWLSDRLAGTERFPAGIPTLIDGADDLESWAQQQMTTALQPHNWDELMLAFPSQVDAIRDARVQLTRALFQHPANPYDRYLLEQPEQEILSQLYQTLQLSAALQGDTNGDWLNSGFLPATWQQFGRLLQQDGQLLWTEMVRRQGQFSLHCAPVEVAPALNLIWAKQPIVLVGNFLDLDAQASAYRQRLGLDTEELTCLKFNPDRQHELIQLYLPDGIPMPNTPQFQPVLMQEIRALLSATATATQGLIVILVSDTPLKAQVGSLLAAEFGSRVQVEKTCLDDHGILVAGWDFWRQHQAVLPAPRLLIIPTLPFPSLEDPLVAGRVAHYKRSRQDWFRLYLLPEALGSLQRAVASMRETQGVVALLDNRVNHRSYGQHVLSALSPLARISYVDASLFIQMERLEGISGRIDES